MDSGLVVVPDADHGDSSDAAEVDRDLMVLSRSERGQPNVQVIIGEILAINKFLNRTWVCTVAW